MTTTTSDPEVAQPPRPRHPVRRAIGLTLVVLLLLGIVWVASVPFRVWWTARQDQRPSSDVLLVLGASQYDGKPSPVLRARLQHALDLYRDGVAQRIVTVGGKREGDRYTEAEAGKAWLVEHGVPSDAIVAVQDGTDTLNSLEAAKTAMAERGWDSAVLVTDPWHSFRSREMARHVGIDAATSPTRTGPIVQQRHTELRYVLRESAAYYRWIWDRLT